MKTALITIIVLLILGIGAYFFMQYTSKSVEVTNDQSVTTEKPEATQQENVAQPEETTKERPQEEVLGLSAGGNGIVAYHYGTGSDELLFIGGIHGGYEWNTVLVAYELMDYLDANPDVIPDNLTVTVIPVLNPDGLNAVVGSTGRFNVSDVPSSLAETVPGRFNAHNVDLNRNFDCDWQPEGVWQDKKVSGGSKAFSEPESQAIRDYVGKYEPVAVVAWYSAVGGVFSSNCHNGVLPETATLTNLYAKASGYKAYQEFNFYEITGDMINWLASKDIPAISVLLTTHSSVEWDKNKKGVDALLDHFKK